MTTTEQKAQQRDQWTASASTWERNTEWLERQLGEVSTWMCDVTELAPGQRVLDVACGTGEPAVSAAARVTPTGRVTAVDLSPAMVEAARRRVTRLGLTQVEVRVMDAEQLDVLDGSFDAAMCRCGLMFCPEPERAAAELHRAIKPGGRFAVVVWDEPAKNPFFTSIGQLIVKLGLAPAPDPTAPGVFRLSAPGELARVLRAGGFTDVRVESRPLAFTYKSPEEYWEIQSEIAAPLKAAVAKLPVDEVARLRAAVIELANQHIEGGMVRLAATPLTATGAR